MNTETKRNDFGNSGKNKGFHPGVFDNGFGEFSTMKKKLKSNDARDNGKILKLNWIKYYWKILLEEKIM